MFWTGNTGKRLRADREAQVFAAYLMTSPHSHQTGIYYLPMMYAAHETGLSPEGASKALQRLIDECFCQYDSASEWVWVRNMAAWQIGTGLSVNDKRCKGVQQYLENLPSLPFLPAFIELYRNDFHLTAPSRPLKGPLEDHSSNRSGSDQDQDQEGSTRETTASSACEAAILNGHDSDDTAKRQTAKGQTTGTPKQQTPKRRTPPKKPETLWPVDFSLDPELEQYVQDHLPDSDPLGMFEKFRLQAQNKQWRYADWRLAFMNYVRNAMPNSGHFAAGQYPRKGPNGVRWQ